MHSAQAIPVMETHSPLNITTVHICFLCCIIPLGDQRSPMQALHIEKKIYMHGRFAHHAYTIDGTFDDFV